MLQRQLMLVQWLLLRKVCPPRLSHRCFRRRHPNQAVLQPLLLLLLLPRRRLQLAQQAVWCPNRRLQWTCRLLCECGSRPPTRTHQKVAVVVVAVAVPRKKVPQERS
jgi:hypothetical protein